MKRDLLFIALAVLLAGASAGTLVAQETLQTKANVLLITADDLGNQLSCYGDDHLKTPRLDALADEPAFAHQRQRLESALQEWREETRDPLLDAARLVRWNEIAARWKASAPRLDRVVNLL